MVGRKPDAAVDLWIYTTEARRNGIERREKGGVES